MHAFTQSAFVTANLPQIGHALRRSRYSQICQQLSGVQGFRRCENSSAADAEASVAGGAGRVTGGDREGRNCMTSLSSSTEACAQVAGGVSWGTKISNYVCVANSLVSLVRIVARKGCEMDVVATSLKALTDYSRARSLAVSVMMRLNCRR